MNEEILNIESNPISATEVEIVTTVQRRDVQTVEMLDKLIEQRFKLKGIY